METYPIQHHCHTCRAACCGNFKKVLTLMDSRLNIYKPSSNKWADEGIILHNTGNSSISKSELMNEFNKYKELCPQCQLFIKKMRNLISNVIIINIKEIRVICNNCKRFKSFKQCKRCNEIIVEYALEQVNNCLCDKQNARTLAEARSLKEFIEKDDKQMKHKSDSLEELLRLIRVKRGSSHKPVINYKPTLNTEVLKDIGENKDTPASQEDVGRKLDDSKSTLKGQNANLSNEDLYSVKSCVCKYVAKTLEKKSSPYNVVKNRLTLENNITENNINVTDESLIRTDNLVEVPNEKVQTGSQLPARKKKINEKNKSVKMDKEIVPEEKAIKMIEKESSEGFMKMIMQRRKNRIRDEVYNLKRFEKKVFGDLPQLPVKVEKTISEFVYEESEHTVECENLKIVQPTEVIKGTKIVHHDVKETNLINCSLKPLLFEVIHKFNGKTENTVSNTDSTRSTNEKGKVLDLKKSKTARIKYELSNTDYIQYGWTVLPEYKIMRRLNIYKMLPSDSSFDWFANNKENSQIFYETGELLADINDGQGRWYYKNGHKALDFFETTDANKMYCVYDVVTKNINKRRKDVAVLAYFDFNGNAVVYDRLGKTRLKYNQSEGVLVDGQIGPPARWKWHTLNDPPVLVGVYQEKYLKPHDKCLDELKSDIKTDKDNINDEMSEIEFKNSVRETLKKISLKYKPIEIRSKVFKLNEHFSLKILSQSKIYLMFKDCERSLKLNVGMKLLYNEIVGVETVDVTDVVKEIKVKRFDKPGKVSIR